MDRPIAFWNSSYVRWPSIWSSTTSPVRGTTALGYALRVRGGPRMGAGPFSVRHGERRLVVPALDEGARRIREVPGGRLARPVHRREDFVPAPFDVRGSVGPPQDACLDPNRSQLIERPTIQAASVGVNQFHLFLDVLDVFHGKPP